MLGFGFGEIVLIVIVAIIVLGPDKLPSALVEIVRVLKVLKRTVQDAKDTIDREVNLAELKREAEDYREKIEKGVDISKDIQDANLTSSIQQNMNEIQYLFDEYQPKKSQESQESKDAAVVSKNANEQESFSNKETQQDCQAGSVSQKEHNFSEDDFNSKSEKSNKQESSAPIHGNEVKISLNVDDSLQFSDIPQTGQSMEKNRVQ